MRDCFGAGAVGVGAAVVVVVVRRVGLVQSAQLAHLAILAARWIPGTTLGASRIGGCTRMGTVVLEAMVRFRYSRLGIAAVPGSQARDPALEVHGDALLVPLDPHSRHRRWVPKTRTTGGDP